MEVYDPGDTYDNLKWDFREDNIPIYYIGKYPYKASSKARAETLANLRKSVDMLCKNIRAGKHEWYHSTYNQEYLDGVNIFLDLHEEGYYNPWDLPEPFSSIASRSKTSRYLLSEIPRGTDFNGLNKPKMRYIDKNAPPVGKDWTR